MSESCKNAINKFPVPPDLKIGMRCQVDIPSGFKTAFSVGFDCLDREKKRQTEMSLRIIDGSIDNN